MLLWTRLRTALPRQVRRISHEEIVQLLTAAAPIATAAIFSTIVIANSNSRYSDTQKSLDQRFADRKRASEEFQKALDQRFADRKTASEEFQKALDQRFNDRQKLSDQRFADQIRAFSDLCNRAADKEVVNLQLANLDKSVTLALATIRPSEGKK